MNTNHSTHPRIRLATVLALCFAPITRASPTDTVCASVTVKISQKLVLTKTVFQASLAIDNPLTSPLENLTVNLFIRDADNHDVTGLFSISAPSLSGLTSLNGGFLAPATAGIAQWSLQATDAATANMAPGAESVSYWVAGTIFHTISGAPTTVNLLPVEIRVFPDASLQLDYFLQQTVYGDDALTPATIELSEPFSLGLILRNIGKGAAKGVSIASADPEVSNNPQGLVVNFKLLSATIDNDPAPASFANLMLGNIAAGAGKVVRWKLTCDLQGTFSDMEASFTHVNPVGDKDVSLIESVVVHPLVHAITMQGPEVPSGQIDALPDFLVDDPSVANPIDTTIQQVMADVPSTLHSSLGTVEPVAFAQVLGIDAAPTSSDLLSTVTVQFTSAGWNYVRLIDPGMGDFSAQLAVRQPTTGLRVSIPAGGSGDVCSLWSTTRNVGDIDGDTDVDTQRLVHLVDYVSIPGTYTYDLIFDVVPKPVLSSNLDVISLATGGAQLLSLQCDPSFAGENYFLLGSVTGTNPGFNAGNFHIPLNWDAYTMLLATSPAIWAYYNSRGKLDVAGAATMTVPIPVGLPTYLVGLNVHHAAIVFSDSEAILLVSNPVFLLFAP